MLQLPQNSQKYQTPLCIKTLETTRQKQVTFMGKERVCKSNLINFAKDSFVKGLYGSP